MNIFNQVFQLKTDTDKKYKVIGVNIVDKEYQYYLESLQPIKNNQKEIVKETEASLKEKYNKINKKG